MQRLSIHSLLGVVLATGVAGAQPTKPKPTPPTPPPAQPTPAAPEPAPPPAPEPPPVVVPVVVVQPPTPPPEPEPAPVRAPDGDAPQGRLGNMGLLFNLNNIFTNGSVLTGYQGFGLGVQMQLAPRSFARLGVELGRLTDPVNIVKTSRTNGADVVVSYDLELPVSGWSSQHAIAVSLDYVKVLGGRSITPYAGLGVFAGYLDRDLDYHDDLTVVDQITDSQKSSDTMSVGVRGIFGVSWRVNDRFSLFAEYHLRVDAIAWEKVTGEDTITNTIAGGTPATSRVSTEFEETRYANIDLGLGQGGALGLVAHF